MLQVNRIGSDRFEVEKQEIVSLTLEPMVIGPIFLSLICDRSRRLLHAR